MYQSNLLTSVKLEVPVVVVGNITVGGTGKTPLVIALAELLKQEGYRVGLVSRGYGGKARSWPQQVRPDSDPVIVGDEPVLMARNCGVPMAVGPDRVAAAQALLKHNNIDLIISDDGLQHYALQRDIEIAVIDGVRRFGNGYCLPAGPLREPRSRLSEVDFVIANGLASRMEYPMQVQFGNIRNLETGKERSLDYLSGKKVHAVAGIGNPDRFFEQLKKNGLEIIEHPFPDHHVYQNGDLEFGDQLPVIMTEKDAVKCRRYTGSNAWYIPVSVRMDERFVQRLLQEIQKSGRALSKE